MVKNLPAMQETQVWSLGREDPLAKGMANHSHLWTEEPGGVHGVTKGWMRLSNTHIQSEKIILIRSETASSSNF